jgi:ABC-type bacteriocin/lantibiotic exporter with double-glycine peptidase domain
MRDNIIYLDAALNSITKIFIQIALLVIIIHGILMLFHQHINIGAFVATVFLSRKFLQPFSFLGGLVDNCRKGIRACGEISLLLNNKFLIEHKELEAHINNLKPIIIKDINYSYANKRVLDNINFEFKSERINVITGSTGSGKTTLLRILMRDIIINRGAIFYGDINIDHCSLASWRKNIAIVPQYPKLFIASVLDNISLFSPHLNESSFQAALELSLSSQFVQALPHGVHSIIGSNGMSLSGGQIQSIALARALYMNSKILLLDEPTAGFDREREKLFLKNLKNIVKNRTLIITSHSQHIIKTADELFEISL